MHKEICFVHVPLYKCLVLLTVSATDNQIILAGNEPNKFFEPEYLAHNIFQLRLLKLCEISGSSGLSLLDCNISSILGLNLLSVRLFFDFEINAKLNAFLPFALAQKCYVIFHESKLFFLYYFLKI